MHGYGLAHLYDKMKASSGQGPFAAAPNSDPRHKPGKSILDRHGACLIFFFLSVTASLGSDFLSLCAAESRAWEHVVYSFAWICVHVHSTGTVLSLRSEMRERVDGENGLLCRHFVVRYAAVTLEQWDMFAEH